MRTPLLIILAVFCVCTMVHAQNLQRRTPVAAGGTGITPTHTLRGSLGQSFIGRVNTLSNIQGVGFWYRPRLGKGATVAVPATEGEIGTRVTIPVMLTHSSRLITNGPRTFTIKLRYNSTVLVYKGPFVVTPVGGDNVVTITGTIADTVGILAELEFLVTLGNAERTDLVLDDVQWEGAAALATERVDGTFQALGVCKAGDTVRLIKRKSTTAITAVAPQPAVDNIDVEVLLGADGPMSLHVIDLTGATVAVLVNEQAAKAGIHTQSYDVSKLITGSYYLVLQMPQQLHTASLIIRK